MVENIDTMVDIDTSTDELLFDEGKDHVENLKIILSIMKKNNISYVNVTEWDDDMFGHWISGTPEELAPFIEYDDGKEIAPIIFEYDDGEV